MKKTNRLYIYFSLLILPIILCLFIFLPIGTLDHNDYFDQYIYDKYPTITFFDFLDASIKPLTHYSNNDFINSLNNQKINYLSLFVTQENMNIYTFRFIALYIYVILFILEIILCIYLLTRGIKLYNQYKKKPESTSIDKTFRNTLFYIFLIESIIIFLAPVFYLTVTIHYILLIIIVTLLILSIYDDIIIKKLKFIKKQLYPTIIRMVILFFVFFFFSNISLSYNKMTIINPRRNSSIISVLKNSSYDYTGSIRYANMIDVINVNNYLENYLANDRNARLETSFTYLTLGDQKELITNLSDTDYILYILNYILYFIIGFVCIMLLMFEVANVFRLQVMTGNYTSKRRIRLIIYFIIMIIGKLCSAFDIIIKLSNYRTGHIFYLCQFNILNIIVLITLILYNIFINKLNTPFIYSYKSPIYSNIELNNINQDSLYK